MRRILFLIAVAALFAAPFRSSALDNPPKAELRSAWLATVWGIDWPSNTGTSASVISKQKAELAAILDNLKAAGLNSVSFQVRSMADAMYKSSYEPWSKFLTGTRGTAPSDASWDPLAYCVEQCHARGLECHAWVNPFRFSTGSSLPTTSLDKAAINAGWILTYKKTNSDNTTTTTHILDPGNAGARARIVNVCREIITNYDVDGLMFDDYFYPEGMPLGSGYDYDEWKASGSSLKQADWRRDNVRKAVSEVSKMIASTRPEVKFGISPAGVGGGNGTASKVYGLPACYGGYDWIYDGIYCDPLPWLADGTIDYISPQIYWTRASKYNPYEPIARWWSEVADHFGRHFYASQSLESFASSNATSDWEERGAQIDINRLNTKNDSPGSVFYSVKYISGPTATGFGAYLAKNHFSVKSLTPALTWKKATDPGEVKNLAAAGNRLSWDALAKGMRYVVYAVPLTVFPSQAVSATGSGLLPEYIVDITYTNSFTLPADRVNGFWYAVAPYDRHSNEWTPSTLNAPVEVYEPIADSAADKTIYTGAGIPVSLKSLWVRSNVQGNPLNLRQDNNYNRDMAVRASDALQPDGDILYLTEVSSIALPSDVSLMRFDAATGERLTDLPLSFEPDYVSVGYTNVNGVDTDSVGNLLVHNLKIGNNPLFVGKVNPISGKVLTIAELSTGNSDRIDHAAFFGNASGTLTVFAASADSNTIYRWTVRNGSVSETQTVVASEKFGTAPRVIALSESSVMINGASSHLLHYTFPSKYATAEHKPSSGTATRANGGAAFSHNSENFVVTPQQASDPGYRFRLMHGNTLPAAATTATDALLPTPTAGLGTTVPPSGDYGMPVAHYTTRDADTERTRFYLYANNNGIAAYELSSERSAIENVENDATETPVANGKVIRLGQRMASARLFDLKGALVAAVLDSDTITAPAEGVYLLRAARADGTPLTAKITVD